MAEKYSQLSLTQKLAKIQAIVDAAKKSKRGFNYSYADINDILANLTAGMKKYGVSLRPSIVPNTGHVEQRTFTNTKSDKQGNLYEKTSTEMFVTADMVYKWVNNDNPEDFIIEPWFIVGSQEDPSQALGSGLTYGKRQFLTNYFHIALVEEDVEQYRKRQKEAEQQEDIATAKAIIEEVDKVVKLFLAENEDKKDEIAKFVGKYIKGSDYRKIKDPILAAKLLEDFNNTYINKEEK